MGNVGLPEILVIAVVGLLIFGPRRLPEIARNTGRALNELRRVTGELTQELKAGLDEPPAGPQMGSLVATEVLPLELPAENGKAPAVESRATKPEEHPPEGYISA